MSYSSATKNFANLNGNILYSPQNGSSRAIQEANDRKARMVTFYKNGEPFSNGITVAIIPSKDFKTMEQLCAYLSNKIKIVNGVQYIFTTNGERVCTINELEHGQCYIVSGVKTFQKYVYGQTNKSRQAFGVLSQPSLTNNSKFIREDLKLLRPLSSKFNTVYSSGNNNHNSFRDGRVITIVNNKDHSLKSKILLNLRSPKCFDIIVKDLGQAVKIKNAKRMFTFSGQEVRSVSQLKRDLADVDLFYLDTDISMQFSESQRIKSISYDSINSNYMNQISKSEYSNEFDALKKRIISRNDSSPDLQMFRHSMETSSDFKHNKRDETNFSINSDTQDVNEISKNFKANETQTSPEFVKSSRRKLKRLTNKSVENAELNQSIKRDIKVETNSDKEVTLQIYMTPQKSKIINSEFTQKTSSNDTKILQEYAETLLRETAFMVQNESFQQNQKEISENKISHRNNNKNKPQKIKDNARKNFKNEFKENSKTDNLIDETELINEIGSPKISTNINTNENQFSPVKTNTEIKTETYSEKLVEISQSPKIRAVSALSETSLKNIKEFNENREPNSADNVDSPDKKLKLKWIHGFNESSKKKLYVLTNGDLAFTVGSIAVLWDQQSNTQRFYTQHTLDIECMAIKQNRGIIATNQKGGKNNPFAIIRVWSAKDLNTYAVFSKNIFGISITDIVFEQQGYLLVLNVEEYVNITVWNWKNSEIIASASKMLNNEETVEGITAHPSEGDIMVTYGKKHLSVWQIRRNGTIDNRTAIKTKTKTIKTFNCVEFLPDHSLLTGDSNGILTIWAPNEDEYGRLEFVVKEVKAHEKSLTSFQLMLNNNILISGDKEGTIKTWDVNDGQFRLLNAIKLSPTSGSVCCIAMASNSSKEKDSIEIYISTSMNFILRGPAINATKYTVIFEGHSLAIRGIATDPKEECFYTAGLDQKICKWNITNLLWKTTTEFQCVSATVHPNGLALATGSVSGTIFILNTLNGNIISNLPLSKVCIGCLAFSPDGELLAAGCQDGVLYILPVCENGFVYEKVSVLKGPFAILTLQWSIDSQYILTSVNDNNYQELILWDLPNSRYMRGVSSYSDSLVWHDSTCSGGEDVRGIWDNQNLDSVINLSCHISHSKKHLVCGDEDGYIRLFSYPCVDFKSSFFEYKQGGGSVTETKFLHEDTYVISCNQEGAVFVWLLIS